MKSAIQQARHYLLQINWSLLVFLLLVMNVKMGVKLAALLVFFILNRKLLADKSIFKQKFIWFYGGMILLVLINILLQFSNLSVSYLVVAATGIIFWLMSIAAAMLITWYVKQSEAEKLHATLSFFFILNIAVSVIQLLLIIVDSGAFNPYRYQGLYQKYFISTGDHINGIAFDVSTTNALISSFGLVYFLSRDKTPLVLLSMGTILLTTSNFANILLLTVLLFLFIFQSTRYQKSVIIICITMLVFFQAMVTPQNDRYTRALMTRISGTKDSVKKTVPNPLPLTEQPDSLLNEEERKKKTALLYIDSINRIAVAAQKSDAVTGKSMFITAEKPAIPKPSIHSASFQRRRDTTAYQRELFAYGELTDPSFDSILTQTNKNSLPGKAAAFKQTIKYLQQHPLKIITGAGAGNFSSKLAFRATGLRMAGGFPKGLVYTHPDFVKNHLRLFLVYFSKDRELHSLVNTPNSVYDQLLAEYGLAGIACFLFFYMAYFRAGLKKYTCGLPLTLLMLGALATEYWFEQLSVIILFELMMLINIKTEKKQDG